MISLSLVLEHLGACSEARWWVREHPHPTFATAWNACPRGDWLLWLAARAGVDRRLIVLAACDCVEEALVHVPPGEGRPRHAIEVARAWARGEATTLWVREAAAAAASAYYTIGSAASYSTDAAARAARAAARGAYACAAYAASADPADADAAARGASIAHSADLVRARINGREVERRLYAMALESGWA